MAITQYERFNMETVHRSQIKNAPYNPRFMGKAEKARLRKAIQKNGLVSALTWNKRTGNLVGGHQRLEQLDALEGNADYDLTVCVIDVDPKEEAEINVKLNNPSMQGEWDLDKLAGLTEDFGLSFEDMGFGADDAAFLFDGDERFTDLFETPEANEEKEKIRQIKEERANMMDQYEKDQSANFITIVVFRDDAQRAEFMKRIHVPVWERYVTAEQVARLTEGTSPE